MRMLDDLTKVRNHYYSVYMEKLTVQVEEQRREIQRRTEQLNRRILRKELQQVWVLGVFAGPIEGATSISVERLCLVIKPHLPSLYMDGQCL